MDVEGSQRIGVVGGDEDDGCFLAGEFEDRLPLAIGLVAPLVFSASRDFSTASAA